MVANTSAHPDVYVLALAISEGDLGDEHRHLIELFNTQVLRLALQGIPVIVPTSPTPGPHQFSRYVPPTFPQSSPYVTTVTFPEPSEEDSKYDVDHTSPAPCPSCLPCKNHLSPFHFIDLFCIAHKIFGIMWRVPFHIFLLFYLKLLFTSKI